jgi:membrane protein DedA with SNARE-associated domain
MKNDATQFPIDHGLPLLFVVAFFEQLGVPIPALPWLLIAGALADTEAISRF